MDRKNGFRRNYADIWGNLRKMENIKDRIALGEDSKNQFKEKIQNQEQLAKEITAFANALGGTIYIGIQDNGFVKGIEQKDLRTLEGHIAAASGEGVVPPINVQTENIAVDGKLVILLHVPEGVRKPYHTRQGEYLTKSGAVKRVLSPEELQRMSYNPSILFEEIAINDTIIETDDPTIETDFNRI